MADYNDKIAYRRNKYYNPKVHVEGWFDIQNDDDYIQKYNQLKQIDLEFYPNLPVNEKHRTSPSGNLKNRSAKELIFYQNAGAESWITENQASFTCHNKT